MGLISLCEKYFKTANLYEVLEITEEATEKEVKKAYHKLSLRVHPDRVEEEKKLEATEKFKVLGSIHEILSNKEKRAVYDETKSVDDDDYNIIVDRDWTVYWRMIFKPVTDEAIQAYEKEYIGSDEEKKDLKVAYLAGKGDMDYIVDQVQFARSEHEERIRGILTELINQGEIPSYKIFTQEPEKKRKRRHAKEKKEAKEAEEHKKELEMSSGANSLELMIRQRQEARASQVDSFFNKLEEKYCKSPKKSTKSPKKATKRKAPTKEPVRRSKRIK